MTCSTASTSANGCAAADCPSSSAAHASTCPTSPRAWWPAAPTSSRWTEPVDPTKPGQDKLPLYPPQAVGRYREAGLWGQLTLGAPLHALAGGHGPPRASARSREAGLGDQLTLAEQSHAVAAVHGHRTAVVTTEGALSFSQL